MSDQPWNEETTVIPEPVLEIPTSMMRLYFVFLFVIVLVVVISLWRRISALQDNEDLLSLRGELLVHVLIFLDVYSFSWLPVLFLGILDGELETASVSEGFKGQLANGHCAIQDLMARTFGMTIVISTSIYLRFSSGKKVPRGCCTGPPSMFLWGLLMPVVLSEVSRFLLSQKEWLMPTHSIVHHLGPIPFSVKAIAPVFCVQQIDEAWLRLVMAEWFLTIVMVVAIVFCCFSCFRQKSDSESEGECESQCDSPQPAESATALESTELQMEDLLHPSSQPEQDSQSGWVTPQESSQDDSYEFVRSDTDSDDDSVEDYGLYARGGGFLEAISCIGVLWTIAARPFVAVSLYALNDGTYSNYLDIPTHVLMIIATAIVPIEMDSKWNKKKDADSDEEEKGEGGGGGGERRGEEETEVGGREGGTLWPVEPEERKWRHLNDGEDDVAPLWLEGDGKQHQDDTLHRGHVATESLDKQSGLR